MAGYGEGVYGGSTAEVATWYTVEAARVDWRDAPLDHFRLLDLLEVAKAQCLAYAPLPADADPDYPPVGHRVAQLMQARNVWNASKTDPASGGIGDDGFMVRVFPMDWTVKALLRPKRAIGAIA